MTWNALLTGASGLLGRALMSILNKDVQWNVTGLAFSRCKGNLKKVNITKREEICGVIKDVKPDVIIHCAAERRPDVVENQENATKLLNIGATRMICEEAAKVGAPVLYMSTDYVFDGRAPPYTDDSTPNPLNKYGQSKLDGEKVTLEVSDSNLILRVPILYGEVESLDESAVTTLFHKVLDTEKICVMSSYERRFPTHVEDVAMVIKDLVSRKLEDNSIKGIFHWSGNEDMTKYDMSLAMAEAFNLSTNHIEADPKASPGATRPYNSQLDCSKLEDMGICYRRPFKMAIKECVAAYFKKEDVK